MSAIGRDAVEKLDPRVRAAALVLRRADCQGEAAALDTMYPSEFADLIKLVEAMLAAADAAASTHKKG